MENYIKYKGKGEHSVNELEKIIKQREEELHLIRSNQAVLPQADVIKSVCEDEELQPIECERHGSCKNCPHYKPVKQTVL